MLINFRIFSSPGQALLRPLLSIPPNTGWVERSYSKLEKICEKRRNRLLPDSLVDLYFLAVLDLPVKDTFSYGKEIKEMIKQ